MAVETPDLVAVPSWSQGTEPNLDRLFTSSDSLTYLELWNFEVRPCIWISFQNSVSRRTDPSNIFIGF